MTEGRRVPGTGVESLDVSSGEADTVSASFAAQRRWSIAFLRVGRGLVALLRETAGIVFVFILATIATFALGALSDLGPAATVLGDSASPEAVANLNREFGLDRPLIIQYLHWIGSMLGGDLGRSWFHNEDVATLIGQRLEVTLSVAAVALTIGIVLGVTLGIVAGLKQGTAVDRGITFFASIISALPPFVFAIFLILIVCVWLRLLPSAGYAPLEDDFWSWLARIILPGIALSLEVIADVARQLRSGLVSVMHEKYVTAAIVRGYSMRRIVLVHVLRNAASPALSTFALRAPGVLGGAVITESIFNMVGYAGLTTEAALGGDVPIVLGTLAVGVVIVLAFSLLINFLIIGLEPAGRRRD
ncbi:ABC transporter permease subunit [Rhizobium lusitanum]|uniref:ABC transporter permease subunit n=1 Tax=Rhizobium lusitanum TaxID=293958 RepID=A0A6L9UGU8_9HYPH|nr:ABC transporter permease [Rhizobium lusitanum]NEI74844.1 ABC transporter permease subunit [Rhizobium lusitanum]